MTIAAAVIVLFDMLVVVWVDMLVFVAVLADMLVVVLVDMLAIDNLFLFIVVSGFHQDTAHNLCFSQKKTL